LPSTALDAFRAVPQADSIDDAFAGLFSAKLAFVVVVVVVVAFG
jgi:hypothetical protein